MSRTTINFRKSYRFLEEIGIGGMGAVYKAFDVHLNREVAIKVIKKNAMDEKLSKRFFREIAVSANLHHPNIIKVFKAGIENDTPYMVMEFVEGVPLLEYINKDNVSLSDKLTIIKKIASALELAHKNKILHRDIKSSNIMVRANGEPVLMDFGLAKLNEVEDKSLTQTGEVLGTPKYMAPEQAQGLKRQVNHQSDLFALGVVFYQVLTNKLPFDGENLIQILHAVVKKKPLPLRAIDKSIPKELEFVCFKSLEKAKKHRYQTARDFQDDIENIIQKKTTNASLFYKKKRIQSLVLFCFVFLLLSGLFWGSIHYAKNFKSVEKKDTLKEMIQNYKRASESHDLENAYIQLSIALDSLEKLKIKQRKKFYSRWKRRIIKALALNYYKRGLKKIENPQEGKIYFLRALSFLDKIQYEKPLRDAISHSLIHYQFKHKNYKDILLLSKGKEQSYSSETLWFITQAHYFCNSHRTLEIISLFQRKLKKNDIRYLETLYYQAMIAIKDQANYRKAETLFRKLWKIKENKKGKLSQEKKAQLYYSFAILKNPGNDLHFPEAKKKLVFSFLRNVKDAWSNNLIYMETKARYNLVKLHDKLSKSDKFMLVQEMLSLMNKAIKTDKNQGEFYFLRAVSYRHMKKYGKAFIDLKKALTLIPSHIESITQMLYLVTDDTGNLDVFRFTRNILQNVEKMVQVDINLFAFEFDILKKQYSSIYNRQRRIPFSKQHFEKFQKLFLSQSFEIQKLAEDTITSMYPTAKVLGEIQLLRKGSFKEVFTKLYHKVLLADKKEKLRILFVYLSQIKSKGKISVKQLSFFEDKKQDLLNILHDEEGNLSFFRSRKNWIYLRFLAARVLVQYPDFSLRQKLFRKILDPKYTLAVRILLAKAFYQTGYVYFDKTFITKNIQSLTNEFLQCAAADLIGIEKKEHMVALKYLLYHGKIRASIISASQICEMIREKRDAKKIIEVFQKGHGSSNPNILAYSIYEFWTNKMDYVVQFMTSLKAFRDFAIKGLKSDSQVIRRTIFIRLGFITKYYKNLYNEVGEATIAILERSASRIEHYHSLVALGSLHHSYIKNKIIFNPKRLLFERVAGFLGFSIKEIDTRKNQDVRKKLMNTIMYDPNKGLRGIILYALSKFHYLYSKHGKFRFFLLLNINKNLSSRENMLLIYTMLSTFNIEVTEQTARKIERIWKGKYPSHIKQIAALTLIIIGEQTKSARIKRIARRTKERLLRGTETEQSIVAISYYVLFNVLKDTGANTVHISYRWNKRDLFLYSINKLKFYSRNRTKRKKYILLLQQAIKIFEQLSVQEEHIEDMKNELYYMYVTLLHMDKQFKRAFRVILQKNRSNKWQKLFMIRLLAKISIQLKKTNVIEKLLQARIVKTPKLKAATLYGGLGYIYLSWRKLQKSEKMFLRQYEILPDKESSLWDLGEYYLAVRNYKKAYDVILENRIKFQRSGKIYFQIARCYGYIGDLKNAFIALKNAVHEHVVMYPKDLRRYPELRSLLQYHATKELMRLWEKTKRRH